MKTGGREMPLQNGRLPPKTGGLTGLGYRKASQHCQPVPPPVDKLPIEKTGEAPV